MADSSAMPDFKDLWDFHDPETSEQRFRDVLGEAEKQHETYRLQLLTQIARTFSLRKMFDEAHAQLDEVQPHLESAEPVVKVRYLLERGRSFNSAGNKEEARPLFIEAWEVAKAANVDGLAVDAAHMMGIIEPAKEAIAWNERALAFAEASDDDAAKNWLGALYNNMGWTYHDQKDFPRALELFEKGLQWREAREQPGPTLIAKWSVGRALRSLNRNEEALNLQLELEKAWEESGKPDGFVYEELGELLLAKGDADAAKPYFAKAYELLKEFGWLEAERLDRMKNHGD